MAGIKRRKAGPFSWVTVHLTVIRALLTAVQRDHPRPDNLRPIRKVSDDNLAQQTEASMVRPLRARIFSGDEVVEVLRSVWLPKASARDVEQLALARSDRSATLAALRSVRGVGPKTSNYLLGLVGDPAVVAVDVRLRNVVRSAGTKVASDAQLAAVIAEAAGLLNVTPRALDGAIWKAKKG